jgi:hypothetical protein
VSPTCHYNAQDHLDSDCTANAWRDYVLDVGEDLVNSNLLFEVEDVETPYNPTGLSVSLWTSTVPSSRLAEHRTNRATGKVWAVGM